MPELFSDLDDGSIDAREDGDYSGKNFADPEIHRFPPNRLEKALLFGDNITPPKAWISARDACDHVFIPSLLQKRCISGGFPFHRKQCSQTD